jgi:5-methylcytosine-specific restriction endonuclease McrA
MTHAEKKIRDLQIVDLRKQGYSQNELCKMFGLKSVGHICKRYGVDGVMSNRKAPRIYGRGNQHSKRTEEERRDYVESFLPSGFSYVGGYVDCDHKVTIKCKTCGTEFDRSMVAIRQGSKIRCNNCEKAKREERKKEKEVISSERKRLALEQKSDKLTDIFLGTIQAECDICGKIFITHNSKQLRCSKECARKANNRTSSHRKDRRIPKNKRVDRGINALSLYKRDNGVCWICGGRCDPNDKQSRNGTIICGDMYPSVDHIIPVCDGGEDSWENVRLAHRICNTRRFRNDRLPPQMKKQSI